MAAGNGGQARSPMAFCDGVWPLVSELVDGEDVVGCYIVRETRRGETRAQKPFLRLVLGDSSGTVDGVIWDDADRWEPFCAVQAIVGVRGRVGSYNDRLQIKIDFVERLEPSRDDLERLLPASTRDATAMDRELRETIASVSDAGLRALLHRCLASDTETGAAYRQHPAATRNHHAYVGGLLEHSLSVAAACDRLMSHYAEQGVRLDRDLVITAALLHDIGKLRELRGFPAPVYTDEGRLLGHIVVGIQMVASAAAHVPQLSPERLLLLQHLIASHQGKPEWDSPRVPQMREALLLHYADDLDAKMNQVGALVNDLEPGEWSGYDRSMGRSFFRPPEAPAVPETLRGEQEEAAASDAASTRRDRSGEADLDEAPPRREPIASGGQSPDRAAAERSDPASDAAEPRDGPERRQSERDGDGTSIDLFGG